MTRTQESVLTAITEGARLIREDRRAQGQLQTIYRCGESKVVNTATVKALLRLGYIKPFLLKETDAQTITNYRLTGAGRRALADAQVRRKPAKHALGSRSRRRAAEPGAGHKAVGS
jgi:hypothetical protein